MEKRNRADLEEIHSFGFEVAFVISSRHPRERTKGGWGRGVSLGSSSEQEGRGQVGGRSGEKQLPERAPGWTDTLKRARVTSAPTEQREELGVSRQSPGNHRCHT